MRITPDGVTNLIAIHVDDMLCAASTPDANNLFKSQLQSKWAISDLGDVKFCLGIGIVQDPERRTIALSQTALIDRIIAQFHQTDAYPVSTPMESKIQFRRLTDTEHSSRNDVDRLAQTPYRSLVGCLMYLAIGTCPDISYPVGKLANFLDCHTVEHWHTAIHVVRYLKGTRNLALVLGGTEDNWLSGYSDANYANNPSRQKSVMGYTFSLGSGTISWAS
jgi:hypothetical protein